MDSTDGCDLQMDTENEDSVNNSNEENDILPPLHTQNINEANTNYSATATFIDPRGISYRYLSSPAPSIDGRIDENCNNLIEHIDRQHQNYYNNNKQELIMDLAHVKYSHNLHRDINKRASQSTASSGLLLRNTISNGGMSTNYKIK